MIISVTGNNDRMVVHAIFDNLGKGAFWCSRTMYEHRTWIARRNGAFTMNSVTNAMRAHILTAAVPYIKQYTDKYVVVKYGGNAMTDPELKNPL